MRPLIAFLFLLIAAPAAAGTWGVGHFHNDQSLDTSSTWADSGTVDTVRESLGVAISASYLESPAAEDALVESPAAEDALVAAEVVAASLGNPNKELPADLAAWIQRQPLDELRALLPQARAALARVRSPDGSELYELWADQGAEEWLGQVDDLVSRLDPAVNRHGP